MRKTTAAQCCVIDETPATVLTWRGTLVLVLVVLYVGGISAYDGYLVVRTGDMIGNFEQNPMGKYLINLNNGDPEPFLRVKAAGTIVVLAVVSLLHRRSQWLARPAEFALVAFQTGLLFYLEHA